MLCHAHHLESQTLFVEEVTKLDLKSCANFTLASGTIFILSLPSLEEFAVVGWDENVKKSFVRLKSIIIIIHSVTVMCDYFFLSASMLSLSPNGTTKLHGIHSAWQRSVL